MFKILVGLTAITAAIVSIGLGAFLIGSFIGWVFDDNQPTTEKIAAGLIIGLLGLFFTLFAYAVGEAIIDSVQAFR